MVTPLIWPSGLAVVGPLTGGGGGVPMSPVDFKKWQCHMSLPLSYARVACQIQEMTMSHVTIYFCPLSHVTMPDVA